MNYRGTLLDLSQYHTQLLEAAQNSGFQTHMLCPHDPIPIVALTAIRSTDFPNFLIFSGVHGDEPAGPQAILELLKDKALPQPANYYILPILNPYGLKHNQRKNRDQRDINRDYYTFETLEAQTHRDWLQGVNVHFDLAFSLHEDWEAEGFYMYAIDREGHEHFTKNILATISTVYPLDLRATIEGMPAQDGLILTPKGVDFGDYFGAAWPATPYLYQEKYVDLCFTFETASNQHVLEKRTQAHKAGILGGIQAFLENTY